MTPCSDCLQDIESPMAPMQQAYVPTKTAFSQIAKLEKAFEASFCTLTVPIFWMPGMAKAQ